jgi:2-amino-4-hydroxy-6-hydroxymethyldihydropteridine diphosphokinase
MARKVILLLGSNISPEIHIPQAVQAIHQVSPIIASSSPWVTHPVGGAGEDYHNLALVILTTIPHDTLKYSTFRSIELELGRVRTDDKNAPRTIDIDIIIDDGKVMDTKIWQYAFVAIPVSQVEPDYPTPIAGQSLREYADGLKKISWIVEHPAYQTHK